MEMQTRRQIAERLGVKLATLATILWANRIEPTNWMTINGQPSHGYDEAKVTQIEALFKKKTTTTPNPS